MCSPGLIQEVNWSHGILGFSGLNGLVSRKEITCSLETHSAALGASLAARPLRNSRRRSLECIVPTFRGRLPDTCSRSGLLHKTSGAAPIPRTPYGPRAERSRHLAEAK